MKMHYELGEDEVIRHDDLHRVAAVMRRLFSEDRMDGDCMRDAAQMLEAALHNVGFESTRHATYDARLRLKKEL